jgi:D-alanyl-lipoteichoic acid acyltransferase DltB (MBOAT superfamily)
MNSYIIQLNKIDFWVVCVVAVALLTPWTRATPRKWVLAGLNLGFLALLLRGHALFLAGAVLSIFVLLQLVGRQRFALFLTVLISLIALGLFVLHKLPALTDRLGLTTVGHVLSFIGFSYVALRMIEVARAVFEKRHPPPDLPSTINYLLPFHMLAAGPIQAYDDFVQQPSPPKLASPREVLAGMERVALGLFKKFVLAFCLQKLFLSDFRANGVYFFVELQVFYVWLFLDFSAYTDIAVGIGNLIGVATPENFNRPFLSRNLIDFWERWHISLSQFIRRNLFIPIQIYLMRKTDATRPLLCTLAAIVVTFVLCGLWHGLSLQFLIFGLTQALGVVIAHVYGQFLQKRIGTKRMKAYRANPWIRMIAIAVTFEYQAVSLLPLFLHVTEWGA